MNKLSSNIIIIKSVFDDIFWNWYVNFDLSGYKVFQEGKYQHDLLWLRHYTEIEYGRRMHIF